MFLCDSELRFIMRRALRPGFGPIIIIDCKSSDTQHDYEIGNVTCCVQLKDIGTRRRLIRGKEFWHKDAHHNANKNDYHSHKRIGE